VKVGLAARAPREAHGVLEPSWDECVPLVESALDSGRDRFRTLRVGPDRRFAARLVERRMR
jgi:hypothetical protein